MAQEEFQKKLQWHILKAEEENARLEKMRNEALAQAAATAEAITGERINYEREAGNTADFSNHGAEF